MRTGAVRLQGTVVSRRLVLGRRCRHRFAPRARHRDAAHAPVNDSRPDLLTIASVGELTPIAVACWTGRHCGHHRGRPNPRGRRLIISQGINMRRTIAIVALAAAIESTACAGLLCIACDGYLGATGEVFEWRDAPAGATSLAFVDTATVNDRAVSPLGGAEISLQAGTRQGRPHDRAATLEGVRTVSDQDGHFRVGGTVRPGRFKASLSVRAPGFQPLHHAFEHDRQSFHRVRVLMVRQQ
jgi:hypothetical protein